MNIVKFHSTSILVLVATLLFITGCNDDKHVSEKENKLPTVQVKSIIASQNKAFHQVEILGTVTAVKSTIIAAKISGNIIDLPVNVGSKVNQGDTLVKIDAGEFGARVEQSQAQLMQARRNLDREKNLLKKNASTPETVRNLEDQVNILEATLREAKIMFEYSNISAPFSGTITHKTANLGDLVTPGKPLLQLDDETMMQIETNIPESLLREIKLGDSLKIILSDGKATKTGRVVEMSPVINPASRTGLVKIIIPEGETLRAGQFGRVLIPQTATSSLLIPKEAITRYGQLERIFVIQDNRARLRLIKTGKEYNEGVEILSGLTAGEQIVTSHEQPLVDDQPVNTQ